MILRVGDLLGLKWPFIIHSCQQHSTQSGAEVGSYGATGNQAVFVCKHKNVWELNSPIQCSQWASLICCTGAVLLQVLQERVAMWRRSHWCGWGTIYSSHVKTCGAFSQLLVVDVLRYIHCGDWWPFSCIWVLILVWVHSRDERGAMTPLGPHISLPDAVIPVQMRCSCLSCLIW